MNDQEILNLINKVESSELMIKLLDQLSDKRILCNHNIDNIDKTVAEYLSFHFSEIYNKDADYKSLLRVMCKFNHKDKVEHIFRDNHIDLACKQSCFITSCFTGNLEIIKFITDTVNNEEKTMLINRSEPLIYVYLPLSLVAENGYLEVVKYLVENGADVAADSYEAIIRACESGHLEIVKHLFDSISSEEKNKCLETMNEIENTDLTCNGNVELIKLLHINGLNITSQDCLIFRKSYDRRYMDIVEYIYRVCNQADKQRCLSSGNFYVAKKMIKNNDKEMIKIIYEATKMD